MGRCPKLLNNLNFHWMLDLNFFFFFFFLFLVCARFTRKKKSLSLLETCKSRLVSCKLRKRRNVCLNGCLVTVVLRLCGVLHNPILSVNSTVWCCNMLSLLSVLIDDYVPHY